MTTLLAGASVVLTVGHGGYVKVSIGGGLASVRVTPFGLSGALVALGPLPIQQMFGSFADGAIIEIRNHTAELDYDHSPNGGLTFSQTERVVAI
ncbi:hypothetical protein UFOVP1254_1, partial [uncultured Caudovirales phage]